MSVFNIYLLSRQRKNKRYVSYSANLGEVSRKYDVLTNLSTRTHLSICVYLRKCLPRTYFGEYDMLPKSWTKTFGGGHIRPKYSISLLLLPLRANKLLHQVKYNQVYGCAKSGSLYDAK